MGSAEVQFCSGQPLRARFGPNESVAGFGQRTDLRLPLDSKKSRFFRRPPRPDDAHGRFKNPGEITLAITTSGARASGKFPGRRIKAHSTSAYRFKKRQIRGVDDLHRPEARGAFAAAFLALELEHEPKIEVDVGEGADARETGRPHAGAARAAYNADTKHR